LAFVAQFAGDHRPVRVGGSVVCCASGDLIAKRNSQARLITFNHPIRERTLKNDRKRVSTRLGAGLLAVVVACAGLAITSGTATATQTVSSLESTRVSGVDVYATSASAALSSHNNAATATVLVSGTSYADGLSAAALAGAVGGPVILTDPDTLRGSTSLAIGQVNSTTAAGHTVHIVGGTSAISADVTTALTDLGYIVSRHSGTDRVSTADAVATYIRTLQDFGTTTVAGASQTTVFLTTARNFADAVAVNGLAFLGKHPILLVDTLADGTTPGTTLSAGTTAVLDSAVNSIERVIILGGTSAVSTEVETAVKAIKNGAAGTTAIQVTRVGGTDRYDTAKLLLELRVKSTTLSGFGHTITNIVLVDGTSHEDGMSATAIAGAGAGFGTLLTDGTGTLNATTSAAITARAASVTTIRAVGRTSSVSAAEVVAADTAATTATTTCSIAANEGDGYITITYSGAVLGAEGVQNVTDGTTDGTGAGSVVLIKRNNVVLALASETTAGTTVTAQDGDVPLLTEVVGSIAAATVATIFVAPVNAIGDVFTVPSATITDAGGVNSVASCSVTVADDVTRPTATVNDFSISGKTGLLSFSEKVTGFTGADLSSTGSDTTFTATAAGGNYYTFTHVDGSAFVSGEVLTITASGFTDLGATALTMAANKTATASTDSSAPTATATIASTTITQPTTGAVGTGGTMVFKALSTGVATGLIGELWSIQGIEGSAGATPIVSLYDGSNRKVVVAADFTSPTAASTPTPASICAAFNAHAEASASFNCVVATGNVASTAVWAATALTGASETSVINVTWSETMNPGVHATAAYGSFDAIANYNVDADGSGTVDADEDVTEAVRTVACSPTIASQTAAAAGCGSATGTNSFISGAMQFLYTETDFTGRLTAGTSALQITASTAADIAGNDATAVTYKITMS
jgi:putative cell wall-binding protein